MNIWLSSCNNHILFMDSWRTFWSLHWTLYGPAQYLCHSAVDVFLTLYQLNVSPFIFPITYVALLTCAWLKMRLIQQGQEGWETRDLDKIRGGWWKLAGTDWMRSGTGSIEKPGWEKPQGLPSVKPQGSSRIKAKTWRFDEIRTQLRWDRVGRPLRRLVILEPNHMEKKNPAKAHLC